MQVHESLPVLGSLVLRLWDIKYSSQWCYANSLLPSPPHRGYEKQCTTLLRLNKSVYAVWLKYACVHLEAESTLGCVTLLLTTVERSDSSSGHTKRLLVHYQLEAPHRTITLKIHENHLQTEYMS
jgi:hypothetical protein